MDRLSYTLARSDHWNTRAEAAGAIQPHVVMARQAVLLFALDRPDGFTDHDLCAHFGNFGSTYCSRRSELTEAGEIVAFRHRRVLPSGRSAVVWAHRSYIGETI